jgi:steroid delta-isomerase
MCQRYRPGVLLSGWRHANSRSHRSRGRQYIEAVGRQDLDGTLALFAEDARQEDPVGSPAHVGRDAVRAFFERAYRGTYTTTLTGPLLVTGDHAAVHFTIEVPTGGEPMVCG